MERFEDDDAGYVAWLSTSSDGYVINTTRAPSAEYLMLHRATCPSITELRGRGTTWTEGDYIKVCGTRAELEQWASRTTGGEVSPCGICT